MQHSSILSRRQFFLSLAASGRFIANHQYSGERLKSTRPSVSQLRVLPGPIPPWLSRPENRRIVGEESGGVRSHHMPAQTSKWRAANRQSIVLKRIQTNPNERGTQSL